MRTSNSNDILADDKFYWSYVTPKEILHALFKTNSNATGSDGIPTKLLKMVFPLILPIIENIFNSSLQVGVFPTSWKTALVTPIPKINNRIRLTDYRPISILPVLSKILERIVCDQMRKFLEENNLLDLCQSAYRRDHSTQTCLIRVLDGIRRSCDRRMVTVAVCIDFSRAFDLVQHHTLLKRLQNMGFSGSSLRWIFSYLMGRRQAVRDSNDGCLSSYTLINSGVPQGSVLGPLLFTLYLADISEAIEHSEYSLYADDLMICLHCFPDEISDGITKINGDVDRINKWAGRNKMLINAAKTQAIVFGTARYLNALNSAGVPEIRVGDVAVGLHPEIRYRD